MSPAAMAQSGLFYDNFDSYGVGTWPAGWTPSGNSISDRARNKITVDPTDPSNRVLQLYGVEGAYWGALAHHPLTYPDAFRMSFKLYNGSEPVGPPGHIDRGAAGMNHGTSWYYKTNPGRNFAKFRGTGSLAAYGGAVLQSYNTEQWYDVSIDYLRLSENVQLTYRVDGQYRGQESVPLSTWDTPAHQPLDHIKLAVSVGTAYFDDVRVTPIPPAPEPIDPVSPPKHTSQYNFVIGAQPYFQWEGVTFGVDLSLNVPGMDPLSYNPSITYPEEPFTPELSPWETSFGTNNKFLGTILSAAAPVEFNALTLNGSAKLSADLSAEAGVYLRNEADHADVGASLGGGINLALDLEATNDLLESLPNQIKEMIPNQFEFTYPIAGAGPFETPTAAINLGTGALDIDGFRQNLADLDPLDEYSIGAEVVGAVSILGVPMDFRDTNGDGDPDEVDVVVGASASAYVETTATAGVDFYFNEIDEYSEPLQSKSMFETFSNLWNRSVEITDETVVVSDTGTVELDIEAGLAKLTTGSPVWMISSVQTDELTNLLAFSADFETELGAEGILQVHWDGELIGTIDERLAGQAETEYLFVLPQTYEAGTYGLSFRLDSMTDVESEIFIGDITTGYMESVPEPATMGLLALGGLALIRRRRTA